MLTVYELSIDDILKNIVYMVMALIDNINSYQESQELIDECKCFSNLGDMHNNRKLYILTSLLIR